MFFIACLFHTCAVLLYSVDVSILCTVRTRMITLQYAIILIITVVLCFLWIKLIGKLLIYLTIQKPYMFRQFSIQGFAAALKPSPFTGVHFKRWQTKTILWLTAMNVYWVAGGTPNGTITPEQEKAFRDATTVFVGAILSVIGDKLVDAYLHMRNAKELWDALEAKFGATDAGSELYAMEQFHDYRMVENRPVVEQAHEIQCFAKELELLKCVLPDKFVAGCIIAKLPPSWRNFATSLKHQRQEISVENLIGSLGVEENARAKDSHTKKVDGSSSANMVQKNSHKFKGKNVVQTTNFKKKKDNKGQSKDKDGCCFVCGEPGYWAPRCPQRKGKKPGQNAKSVNVTIGSNHDGAASGYGNSFTVFFVC